LLKSRSLLVVTGFIILVIIVIWSIWYIYNVPRKIIVDWRYEESLRPYFDKLSRDEARDMALHYCLVFGLECEVINITKSNSSICPEYYVKVRNTLDNYIYILSISSYNGGLTRIINIDVFISRYREYSNNSECKWSFNVSESKIKQGVLEKLHSIGYYMITDLHVCKVKEGAIMSVTYSIEVNGNRFSSEFFVRALIDPCTGELIGLVTSYHFPLLLNIDAEKIIDYQAIKSILDENLRSRGISSYKLTREDLDIAIIVKYFEIEPLPIWRFNIVYYREGQFYEEKTIIFNAYTGELIMEQ